MSRFETLESRQRWLAGQNEAFKATVNGAPLEAALEILISTATEQVGGNARGAFYLLNGNGSSLRRIVGMSEDYVRDAGDLAAGVDSFAHSLAIGTAKPVITADVCEEPRWESWLWLAEKYKYRACWSFPVESAGGKQIGTLALYFEEPHSPTAPDLELAESLCRTASIIIAHHHARADLRETQRLQTAMLEVVPVGMALVDNEGNLLMSNPEMERFLPDGMIPSVSGDRSWRWQSWDAERQTVLPDDFPSARALRGERVVPGMEFLYKANDQTLWTKVASVPVLDDDGAVTGAVSVVHDIDVAKRAEEAQRILLAELQHRVRNTLAIVKSIVARTAESSTSVEEMAAHLAGRLDAFARVQSAVTRNPTAGVDLEGLIADELLAHATRESDNVSFEGPDISLRPKAAESVSLALHELTTNAVKHGALAIPDGRISIDWELDGDGTALRFLWSEDGLRMGKKKPARRGFGMELLTQILPYDLGAKTKVAFSPEGLRFSMDLPLEHVHPGGGAITYSS